MKAGILGGILYITYDSMDSSGDQLVLTDISTGQKITGNPKAINNVKDPSVIDVLTPWGVATRTAFYPAVEWLDPASAPASPSSSAPSDSSGPETAESSPTAIES